MRAKEVDLSKVKMTGGPGSRAVSRERAVAVYRALVAGGPHGLHRDTLAAKTGLTEGQVLEAVVWMRAHGVSVTVQKSGVNELTKVILLAPIPASWAP